jgi:hypothetical protein
MTAEEITMANWRWIDDPVAQGYVETPGRPWPKDAKFLEVAFCPTFLDLCYEDGNRIMYLASRPRR